MKNISSILVLGAGVSGLAAAIRLAEKGVHVTLVAPGPSLQAPSAALPEGFNAGLNEKDVELHFKDSILTGAYLANQDSVLKLCRSAPMLLDWLDRIGTVLVRSSEGRLARFATLPNTDRRSVRGLFCTGHDILSALDSQARRFESMGLIVRLDHLEFVSAVLDDQGICQGIVAQNLSSMEFSTLPAEAVLFCTGRIDLPFGFSSAFGGKGGYAAIQLYQQGAAFANPEFVEWKALAVKQNEASALLSPEILAGPVDLLSREDGKIKKIEEGFSALQNFSHGEFLLDLTRKNSDNFLQRDLKICRNIAGVNPSQDPVPLHPAFYSCLGGLWIDENHMTSLPGIFAAGDCQYQYHGAASLSGNTLPAALFGGIEAADRAVEYLSSLKRGSAKNSEPRFDEELRRQRDRYHFFADLSGPENPRMLHRQLEQILVSAMGPMRDNETLKSSYRRVNELKERFLRIGVADKSPWMNREAVFVRHLQAALEFSQTMILAATLRDESRGVHRKKHFAERDDSRFLKTTKMWWGKENPRLVYEDLDLKYFNPDLRRSETSLTFKTSIGSRK